MSPTQLADPKAHRLSTASCDGAQKHCRAPIPADLDRAPAGDCCRFPATRRRVTVKRPSAQRQPPQSCHPRPWRCPKSSKNASTSFPEDRTTAVDRQRMSSYTNENPPRQTSRGTPAPPDSTSAVASVRRCAAQASLGTPDVPAPRIVTRGPRGEGQARVGLGVGRGAVTSPLKPGARAPRSWSTRLTPLLAS